MKFKSALLILSFALVAVACSPESPRQIIPPLQEKVVDDDDDVQYFDPQVDILFVIDNSGSMGVHQANLSANVSRFAAAFQKKGNVDYHIGIVSTDMDRSSRANCCGNLIGTPNFVDRNTPNGIQALAVNMMLGTDGTWQEMSLDPMMEAISPALTAGPNAGFYREDAHFAVIFITDAEDQSTKFSPKMAFDLLVTMKKGDPRKVLGYGVIVPSGDRVCRRDESTEPKLIEQFLSLVVNTGKNVFNLCDPAFGDRVAEIADDLVGQIANVIFLNRPPDVSTIKVTFGSQVIPPSAKDGWSYDPSRNAIVLGPDIVWSQQPSGTKVKVDFSASTYIPR